MILSEVYFCKISSIKYWFDISQTGDIEVMIAEQEERKKKLRAQMAAKRAAEERQKSSRLLQTGQEEELEDIDLTFLDKPIRKNGQWIHRPSKPRYT